jgi:dihydropteroate synthase
VLHLPPLIHPVRRIGRRTFDFSRQIAVLGIVNRTADSFFDRGRTFALDQAVAAALEAAHAGAELVDVGAVPFSPDAAAVSEAEEIDRVVPVIEAVAAATDVALSVDTTRPEVARAAIAAGAAMINDTSGLRDRELGEVVAETDATLVITHSLAAPGEHWPRPQYDDVVTDVRARLAELVELAVALGVSEERIVVDPGFDLNKNTLHSLELTRRLDEITALGLPVLAAVSNKDFVGEATGLDRAERGAASIAAASVAAFLGARLLRMHDVRRAVQAATMIENVLGLREPAHLRHNLP